MNSDTEKLLAGIEEACADIRLWSRLAAPHKINSLGQMARTWLPELVKIVREQQGQLEDMRGDLVSLMEAPVCLDPECNDERCAAYRKYWKP